jgi:hypothetical protein
MNKWQEWYDSLPQHTKLYLDGRAIWKDSDLLKSFVVGLLVGIGTTMIVLY